jgi:hypothetical protein
MLHLFGLGCLLWALFMALAMIIMTTNPNFNPRFIDF